MEGLCVGGERKGYVKVIPTLVRDSGAVKGLVDITDKTTAETNEEDENKKG